MLIRILCCYIMQLYLFHFNTSLIIFFFCKEADYIYFTLCRLHSLYYDQLSFPVVAQNQRQAKCKRTGMAVFQ